MKKYILEILGVLAVCVFLSRLVLDGMTGSMTFSAETYAIAIIISSAVAGNKLEIRALNFILRRGK